MSSKSEIDSNMYGTRVSNDQSVTTAHALWSKHQIGQMLTLSLIGGLVGAFVGLVLSLTVFSMDKTGKSQEGCAQDNFEDVPESLYENKEWPLKCGTNECRTKTTMSHFLGLAVVGACIGASAFLGISFLMMVMWNYISANQEFSSSRKVAQMASLQQMGFVSKPAADFASKVQDNIQNPPRPQRTPQPQRPPPPQVGKPVP